MGFYNHRILPCLLHLAMQTPALEPYRRRAVARARGRVLEIGVGSGLNLELYGATVECVVGIEPSPELLCMARGRAAAVVVPIELVQASAEALPLATASVDTVVTTWTLCTIPDPVGALREVRRVLRPDGALLFVEHGRAPEPGVARWQDRLTPLWRHFAGGCHLNRAIPDLITTAGFAIERLDLSRVPGPRTHTFMYEGWAGASAAPREAAPGKTTLLSDRAVGADTVSYATEGR